MTSSNYSILWYTLVYFSILVVPFASSIDGVNLGTSDIDGIDISDQIVITAGSSSSINSSLGFSSACGSNQLAYYINSTTIGCYSTYPYNYSKDGIKWYNEDEENYDNLLSVDYEGFFGPKTIMINEPSNIDILNLSGSIINIKAPNSNINGNLFLNQSNVYNLNGSAWSFGSGSSAISNIFNQYLNTSNDVMFGWISNITAISGRNLTTIQTTIHGYIYNGTEFINNKPQIPINLSKAIFYYHFNNESRENDSNFVDFSGNGFNMSCTTTGCPIFNSTAGVINKSLQFDGSNDQAVIPRTSSNDITDAYTISIWVRMDAFLASSKSPDIIDKTSGTNGINLGYTTWSGNNGINIAHMVSGSWACTSGTKQLTSSDLRVWHHYIATWNRTRLMFYVDGELYSDVACTQLGTNTNNWLLARHYSNPASYGYLPASIDELLVLNNSINSSDALAIYNYQKPFLNSTNTITVTSQQGFNITRQIVNVRDSDFRDGYWNGTAKNATDSVYAVSPKSGGSFITSSNIASQSVSYADECGYSYDSATSSEAQIGLNMIDCTSHPSSSQGAIAYDYTNNKPVYHDGSSWVAFDGGATSC